LVVVRWAKGNPNSLGSSCTWYDIRDPRDAAKLAKEEQRLKSIGAEYYVARGLIERQPRGMPNPAQ
jgi:hypothetical protein